MEDRIRAHLARYVLRPPVAQDALEPTRNGNVMLTLRRAWDDGTRAVLFVEPCGAVGISGGVRFTRSIA